MMPSPSAKPTQARTRLALDGGHRLLVSMICSVTLTAHYIRVRRSVPA